MNEAAFVQMREERDTLLAEVANLREMLAVATDAEFIHSCRQVLRLTPGAGRLLHILVFGRRSSKLALLRAYYNGDDDGRETKIIDIQICHVRRALKPYGIVIETIWGDGYRMTAEAKAAVLALLGIEAKP